MEYDEREADLAESKVLQKLELGPALYLTTAAAFCAWMPYVSGLLAAGAAVVIWIARNKAKEVGHSAYMDELAMKRRQAERKLAEDRVEKLAAEHAELRRFALAAYWLIRRAEVLVYERQDCETIPISYPEFPIEPPPSISTGFEDDEERAFFAERMDAWASAQPRTD
jgi:hypothetical protein